MLEALPQVKGKLRSNAMLAASTWFGVGGPADVLFRPENTADLQYFLANTPLVIPIHVLGVGSNILVRDGGIEGVVVRLGKGFTSCRVEGETLIAGAGCLNSNVVSVALEHGIGGLEFLSGIPGSIGGAVAMNAGAYNRETKDIILSCEAINRSGNIRRFSAEELLFSYRKCALPPEWIFNEVVFQGYLGKKESIKARIDEISASRNQTQPVRSRTGGSTFKNPSGHKAWQLIDAAGCRGLTIGGAQISELHCNFMINKENATASELETLGKEVQRKVLLHSGIALEWEIKVIGR